MASTDFRDYLISDEQCEVLAATYDSINYAIINGRRPPEYPDSKEYIYDLHVLQNYLQYIREKAGELGIESPLLTIKMGQYPENELIDDRQNPNYKGYQVIYLRATQRTEEAGNVEISGIQGLDFTTMCPPPYE